MVVVVGLPTHSQVKWEKNRKELKELFPEGLEFLVPSADEQIQNWGLFFSFPWFSTNYSSARPCNFGPPQGKWSRNLTFPDPFRKLEKCGHTHPPSILSSMSHLFKFFVIPSMLIMGQLWNLSSPLQVLGSCLRGKPKVCLTEKETAKHSLHHLNCPGC